ncbi:oligosaccharide flippase family protein [Candidatus Dojkabacteria bacterium]|nr:oligosaccharide flippase family protein [Candidatus Dojkabacteria bacterium]
MFKKISKNIIVLLFANGFYFLFSFLAAQAMNHALMPAELGIFNLVTFYLLLIQNISDLGQNSITARDISQKPKNRATYFWNSLYLRLLIFAFAFCIVLIITPFIHNYVGFASGLLMGPVLVLMGLLKAPIDVLQQVDNNLSAKAISEVAVAGVKYVLFFIIVRYFTYTSTTFIIATSLAAIVWFFVDFIIYKTHIPPFIKPDKIIISKLLKQSILIGIVITLHYLTHELNKAILDITSNAYEVGIYSAAQKILTLATVIPGLIMTPIFPEIARNIKKIQNLKKIFLYAIIVLSILGLGISLAIYIFSNPIIDFINGSEYMESVIPLRVITLGIPFVFWQHLWGYTLISFNKAKIYLVFSVTSIIVNIFVGTILCQLFGATGASVTFVIAEGIVSIASAYYVIKKLVYKSP